MQPILVNMAALSVAVIYYTWRSYHQAGLRKQALLRQRVAYMLWCAADCVVGTDGPPRRGDSRLTRTCA